MRKEWCVTETIPISDTEGKANIYRFAKELEAKKLEAKKCI